jgi:hypothetical protein
LVPGWTFNEYRHIANAPTLPAIKMDTLRLQKYNRQGSMVDNEINMLDKDLSSKKKLSGNVTLTQKGDIKTDKEFLEYFINDKPLSELLDQFYNSKTCILDNWIGALGSSINPKTDIIKVKQLLGKHVTDKEIRQVYPSSWTDKEFKLYLDKNREELENPEILIYCCAECGDYDCGGIAVTIDKTDTSVIWTIHDGNKTLKFEFDKHLYFDVFNRYLRQLAN